MLFIMCLSLSLDFGRQLNTIVLVAPKGNNYLGSRKGCKQLCHWSQCFPTQNTTRFTNCQQPSVKPWRWSDAANA